MQETLDMNYRELSMLSPIKLMSNIVRKRTVTNARIGHYELSGSIYLRHNYEFPEVAYGGMNGLQFQRDDHNLNIDMERIRRVFLLLQQTHYVLQSYTLPQNMEQVIQYHIRENNQHVRVNNNWRDYMMMTDEGVNPMAAEIDMAGLIMGKKKKKKQ